ncbi:cytochrome c [bacterium]|nr:cytochrome c [bacterium]
MRYFITGTIFILGLLSIICWSDPSAYLLAQAQQTPDGKALFTQHCLNCHSEEGIGSVLTTNRKTSEEWKIYFTEGKHLGQNITLLADPEKIKSIAGYCIKNAKTP